MYVYDAAGPAAALLSYTLAGWLNEVYGWRLTFLLVSIPCLLLAVLFKYTIIEPREERSIQHRPPRVPPLREVIAAVWRQRSCRHITIAFVLIFIMSSGLAPWKAAFMIRSHGFGTAELGAWMGMIAIGGSAVGLLAGSYVVGRWFGDNERGQLRMCALTIALAVPFFVIYLTLPNRYLALSAQLPQLLLINSFLPAAFALIQRLVPDEMRATVLSVVMTLANLVGMGIGPQLVGVLSDLLAPALGIHSLRYGMLIVSLIVLWAAYHLWLAARTVRQDLSRMTQWAAANIESLPPDASIANPARAK
jgi:MFS family permease